jgi:flagellar motility protein MotE (MotC chaperone)
MMPPFVAARLLPVTIAVMAALLTTKTVVFVRRIAEPMEGSPTPMLVSAQAVAAEASHGKASDPHAEAPKAQGHPASEKSAHDKAASEASTASHAAQGADPAGDRGTQAAQEPPIDQSERAVLLELRQRRQELDAREATLSARESMLAAADQKLAGRVAELLALQKKLEALEAGREQREEASWQGLVKVYETMKPRDAATIFNDLSPPVLLNVLDRMKESKAAPVLAAMNPDKARDVTSQLAQLRTQRNAAPDASVSKGSPPPSSPAPAKASPSSG